MRNYRLLFAFFVALGPVISTVAGCGDDDKPGSNVSNSTNDSGTTPPPPSTGSDASTPVSIKASATNVSVYLGHAVTFDGSGSTGPGDFTYAWTMKSVPAGSTVTTASLSGAATAKPTFSPDKVGSYVFTLTTTSGSASSTADATANVIDPPIFYLTSEFDGGEKANVSVTGASGSATPKPVGCFANDAGFSYATAVTTAANQGSDFWEAPAGQPSKTAFVMTERTDAGTDFSTLYSTTSAGDCATAPTAVDFVAKTGNTFETPRISPNGSRVLYTRDIGANGAHVTTAGLDGSDRRDLGSLFADSDGGAVDAGFNIRARRPVWINDTTVAWYQTLAGSTWQITKATDAPGATPSVYMRCTAGDPDEVLQFDVLANGDVIVGLARNGEASFDIITFSVDGSHNCVAGHDITALVSTHADTTLFAQEFSLSPDKQFVAWWELGGGISSIMVAKTDGTGSAVSRGTSDSALRGPRWVGGGAFLAWGVDGPTVDAGTGNAIAVVPVDGGTAYTAATASPSGTLQAMSTCTIGRGVGSGVTAFGVGGLFVLHVLRRRRRRNGQA